MATGWLNIGGAWFYLDGSGAMVANGWRSWVALGTGSTIPVRWPPAGVRSAAPGTTLAVPALWPTTPGSATTTSSLPAPWLRMQVGSYYVGEDGKWIPDYGLVWYKSGSDVYHTHKCRTVGKDAKGYSQISIQRPGSAVLYESARTANKLANALLS